MPPVHAKLAPQPPQFDAVVTSVSHPSAAFPLQSAYPVLQEATAHFPALQPATAFATLHGLHELPQLFTDVLLWHVPLQGCCPAGQPQTPF